MKNASFFKKKESPMKNIVSKHLLASAGLAVLASAAMAQTAPAEPESTLAYNAGVVSEYRYRGISQSRFQPAVQGGADYADKSGLYIGTWASSIKWIKDNGVGNGATGPVELDIYGGYKFPVGDVAMDVGVLRYQYVNNTLYKNTGFKNANTTEVYAAATVDVFTLKYSYALTNLFGQIPSATGNTKGSGYLDLSATFDLGDGYSLVPHAGHQAVSNMSVATYSDYNLALNKDLGNGLVLSATAYNTNAKLANYAVPAGLGSDSGKNLGKSALVLGAKYTF
jgi:uncharacterized protein (TIGR02001 family)